jgi:VWFA-related protein
MRVAAAAVLTLGVSLLTAQDQTPDAVIRSDVREVVLDVVVRHKDLSLVKNLKPSDFAVTEDGVSQTIKTFRLVGGREAQILVEPPTTPGTPAPATSVKTLKQPNFVSIVFDGIGPDWRAKALEIAADFLDQQFQDNTYASVFALNLRLNPVVHFTNDRAALASAARLAITGNALELSNASANVLNNTNYSITGGMTGITLTPGIDLTKTPDMSMTPASQNPLSESQQYLANLITSQREMVTYNDGMRVLTALLRLVEVESRLPGRKTVLYLSPALVKPPAREDYMRTLVSAANRANVSFYCVDVRGLTSGTSNGEAAGLEKTAAQISSTQPTMSESPSGAMRQASQFDVMEQSFVANGQLSMAELAQGTGGFAVFNTNDFKRNMARIMEDIRSHFEISYVPVSNIYDGRFRRVKVTVKDPKLIVQTREGYFALPEMAGAPMLPYEVPALHALEQRERHDFDFHAAALRFRPWRDGYRYEMAFDVDTANLTAGVNPESQKARLHAVFLALIKDARGQVVNKVSQEIDREVPRDKFELFRRGRIVFTGPFEAASGRYTIEAAAVDPEGGRASTRRFALIVPKPGEPALSNIAVVRRIDALEAARDPGNPFEFDGGKVTPDLTQTGGLERDPALFFVVYPNAGTEKPSVSIAIYRDGAEVARERPEIGEADEVNSFPVIQAAKLPPGDYTARITVEQAGRASQEVTAFRVNP